MVEDNQIDLVFRAIADPTRRAMLERLSDQDLAVGELAEPFEMSFAAASKHIGVLEGAGLLTRRKQGRQRICRVNPDALFAVRDWVERYSAFWNARLDALDQAIREDGDE